MADDFGKFIDKAQGGDRLESRFMGLESELMKNEPATRKKAKYLYQCRVFTVFRPWQECQRCLKMFRPKKNADGDYVEPEIVMQEDADYVCPHNEKAEYVALVNRIARAEVQLVSRAMETLKPGVVQALVEWGEPLQQEKPAEPEGLPRL
jgi:hypothetical protein